MECRLSLQILKFPRCTIHKPYCRPRGRAGWVGTWRVRDWRRPCLVHLSLRPSSESVVAVVRRRFPFPWIPTFSLVPPLAVWRRSRPCPSSCTDAPRCHARARVDVASRSGGVGAGMEMNARRSGGAGRGHRAIAHMRSAFSVSALLVLDADTRHDLLRIARYQMTWAMTRCRRIWRRLLPARAPPSLGEDEVLGWWRSVSRPEIWDGHGRVSPGRSREAVGGARCAPRPADPPPNLPASPYPAADVVAGVDGGWWD
ncbi:hypothetical protein B0H13DRAFT_41450 [Mycena leptocephala]|nr:hypothetical protein B0H13DRAFT_41450 [Mycena leptocephala]